MYEARSRFDRGEFFLNFHCKHRMNRDESVNYLKLSKTLANIFHNFVTIGRQTQLVRDIFSSIFVHI